MEAETQWTPFRRRYLQMHFPEGKYINFKISLQFVPKCLINNIPVLVQIMAWLCSGHKPLSKPMMINLPTHICVTRPQWVKAQIKENINAPRHWHLCWEFRAQKASYAGNFSIWWRNHELLRYLLIFLGLFQFPQYFTISSIYVIIFTLDATWCLLMVSYLVPERVAASIMAQPSLHIFQ